MNYRIIEDCSPYFIRFTYDGIDDFNSYALNIFNSYDWEGIGRTNISGFMHYRLDKIIGQNIINLIPSSNKINFNNNRVSFFKSWPGLYYRAHKDGMDHRFSINYTLKILDDKCITSWYDDADLKKYHLDQTLLEKQASRECVGFDKKKHKPLKTMVAKPNECILFNTEIFHDWDNTTSSNERLVLTLRSTDPGKIYFDDVKKLLFEGKL